MAAPTRRIQIRLVFPSGNVETHERLVPTDQRVFTLTRTETSDLLSEALIFFWDLDTGALLDWGFQIFDQTTLNYYRPHSEDPAPKKLGFLRRLFSHFNFQGSDMSEEDDSQASSTEGQDKEVENLKTRECLELAAKAIKLEVEFYETHGSRLVCVKKGDYGPDRYWRPDENDGDSRRLEVALGLEVSVHRSNPAFPSAFVAVRAYEYRRLLVSVAAADNGESLVAATRRAVLLAAGEMGRLMP